MTLVTQGGLLGGKISYRQLATGHRSGFEPVLLAAGVAARPGQMVLEAGAGAGAALLCLGHRVTGLHGTGIEIDPALVALANENFQNNGLDGFVCVQGDAAQPGLDAIFDHAIANPPWHDAAATRSPDQARALAHHAGPGLLAAWIDGLAACLKPRGYISLILPAAVLSAAACRLRSRQFGAVMVYPLWPRAGAPAAQVIITARLGARGADRLLAGLILHDAAGMTPAAEAILRDGAALAGTD